MSAQLRESAPLLALVGFPVGGVTHALPVENVREVLRPGPVSALPGARPGVLGLMSVRGRVLPLLDLAVRLGGEPAPRPAGLRAPCALLVEARSQAATVVVDGEVEVLCVPLGEIDEAPEALCARPGGGAVVGVARPGGRVILLLDAETLLSGGGR